MSTSRLQKRLNQVQYLSGWGDLTKEQIERYKELLRAELEAQIKTHEYLNSLIEPLDDSLRDQIYESNRDEFMSANLGDGMDEGRVDNEVELMSDWEFVLNFGREK